MLNEQDYNVLYDLVFRKEYPGYKPNVFESPFGDGKIDTEKRYAHVSVKYQHSNKTSQIILNSYLMRAHCLSLEVATALKMPKKFFPKLEYGALRILEYPIGAISNEHKDFNLFTIMLYRNQPDKFIINDYVPKEVSNINSQCHLGELAEIIGFGNATKHEVTASETVQRSIVYFSVPDWKEILPNGNTVGGWLEERLNRSRIYK